MLLYGKNSVHERLKANPKSIQKIIAQDTFRDTDIERLIARHRIPVEHVSLKALARIKPAENLQGIVAYIDTFIYTAFEDALSKPHSKPLSPVFLNKIYDPQNLGAIIRTAACLGGFSVVIPRHRACEVTETVLHVAQGGENYVPVSMVTNISTAIRDAKERGYWIAGALVTDDAQDIGGISLPFPLGIVLGSEGEGLGHGVQRSLDIKMRIPMKGAGLSFNVAIACAILCYEISRKRMAQ